MLFATPDARIFFSERLSAHPVYFVLFRSTRRRSLCSPRNNKSVLYCTIRMYEYSYFLLVSDNRSSTLKYCTFYNINLIQFFRLMLLMYRTVCCCSVRVLRASRVSGVRAQQLQELRHVPAATNRTLHTCKGTLQNLYGCGSQASMLHKPRGRYLPLTFSALHCTALYFSFE